MVSDVTDFSVCVYVNGKTLWERLRQTPTYHGDKALMANDSERLDWFDFWSKLDTGEAVISVHRLDQVIDKLQDVDTSSMSPSSLAALERMEQAFSELPWPPGTLIELCVEQ